MRRVVPFGVVSLLLVAACGERMIFEASTDLTIAGSAATATTTPTTDDTESPVDVTRPAGTISWSVCPPSVTSIATTPLDCGKLAVPYDYANDDGRVFTLHLVRRPADDADSRIGSMLVNPGGPGFGGTTIPENAEWYVSETLRSQFDIIGWDPRGTGLSTPAVNCIDDYDPYFGIDSPPNDAAAETEMVRITQEFVDLCIERSGDILPYISTEASARDIDAIRAALGEEKITYFGFSYGSELGATWVTLFPNTVRAAVFDGASDPNANGFDQAVAQLKGFEQQLNAFFADCAKRPTCKIYNAGKPAALFDKLVVDIDAQPLTGPPGRTAVTQGVFYTAVVQAMYSNTLWPQLETALAEAVIGNGRFLLSLYDDYYQRKFDGTYGNELEAFLAISCLDDPEESTVEEINADVAKFVAAAPRLGANFGYGYTCALWPTRVATRVEVNGKGAGPIVVIGTTGDAATPLDSTRKAAKNLEQGVLVIVEADRHTGYGLNSCVVQRVDDYLVNLKVPDNETYCR